LKSLERRIVNNRRSDKEQQQWSIVLNEDDCYRTGELDVVRCGNVLVVKTTQAQEDENE
jgi:hypothetical protein